MEATERGRALMVRALMKELEKQQDKDDGGYTQIRFPGPLAVALADAVVNLGNLLIVGGGAFQVQDWDVSSVPNSYTSNLAYTVHVVNPRQKERCVWCGNEYSPGDPGAVHKLCTGCWENGPLDVSLKLS